MTRLKIEENENFMRPPQRLKKKNKIVQGISSRQATILAAIRFMSVITVHSKNITENKSFKTRLF